ncbi:MAG: class I SAM-dependent methyltransferase [Pseudomonadota bacterium]
MNIFKWDFRKSTVDKELSSNVMYYIDELILNDNSLSVTGWLFHPEFELESLMLCDNLGNSHLLEWFPSTDVALHHGAMATQCRFQATLLFQLRPDVSKCFLETKIKGDKKLLQVPLSKPPLDPYHRLFADFVKNVNAMPTPSVLELGSRARSGNVYSSVFNNHVSYKGLDIAPGVNVDIVGDAHELSQLFTEHEKFDAIFSISVFEHLAMPWKVVLECNKILKPNGMIFIASHQTWPLHDAPWDFWRFSSSAWQALFNSATGFKVIETVMGLPCSIKSNAPSEKELIGLYNQPAFLGTAVIAQKNGETRLEWPVDTKIIVEGLYPG